MPHKCIPLYALLGFALVLTGAGGLVQPQAAAYSIGDRVDTYDIGEVVDHLRLGFRHWSSASGDPTPDVLDGIADLDDSAGDHQVAFTTAPYSVWDEASEVLGISHWPFTLDPNNVMSFVMTAPAPGQYVVAFQGLFHTSGRYYLEYRKGAQWISIPDFGPTSGDAYQTLLFCFVIETDPGQTQIPMRIYSTGYKLGIGGFVLGKLVEDPFAGSPTSGIPHGNAILAPGEAATIWARTTGNTFLYNRYLGVKNEGNASNNLSSGYFNNLSRGIVTSYWGKLLINTLLSELDGSTTRRNQAIQMLDKCVGWADFRTIGKLHHGSLIRVIAIAYDHLYDHLTPTQRNNIRRKLDRETRDIYIDYLTMNQSSLGPRFGNWGAVTHSGMAAAGLVLRNESRYAQQYLDRGRWGCQGYLESGLTASGSCRESYGYYNFALGTLAPVFVMFKNILGEDLVDHDGGVAQQTVPYSLYLLAPTRDGFFNFDDMDYGYSHNAISPIGYFSVYKQDPLAHALLKRFAGEDSGRSAWPGWRPSFRLYSQLWYDPNMASEDPDTSPRMPLAAVFAEDGAPGAARWGSGHVVMRTGFTSDDDIAFALQGGDSGGFHGHPDQGAFLLTAYGGQLVSHVGKFGSYSSAGSEWAHRGTSSSVVLIDGVGQVDDHRWGNGRMARDGTIDDFYHDPSLADYALANAEPAYDDGNRPVDAALRHVLFVRKPQRRGYFVIADDLQSSSPGEHDYSWLLHGSNWHRAVLGTGGSFRFEKSSNTYDGQASKFEGRDADLQVMFATPQDPAMEIVNREYVNGQWTYFPPYVKSTYRAERGVFVALLYPESARLGVSTPPVTRIDQGDVAGFRVGDDLILFHKGQGAWTYESIQTDARLVYLEMSDPQETRYLVAAATTLMVGNVEVLSSAQPVTTSGSFAGGLDTDPPTIVAWYSCGEHGRGVGEAMLAIPDDGTFSEPRTGGIGKLMVTFSEPMDPVSFAGGVVEIAGLDANGAAVDLSGIATAIDLSADDITGTVTIDPPLPDFARYLVRIGAVADLAGNELGGGRDRIVTALVGDVSGDLRVNATDFSRVRAARARLIDPGDTDQCRADVSGDGRVNAADLSRVRGRRANDATGIPDPVISN